MKKGTYKHSVETRKRMSLSNKGQTPWNKGKHQSEETKKKMSLAKIGHSVSAETREKLRLKHTGKILSAEHRKKIGRMGSSNPNWRGGRTSLNMLVRSCLKYRQWRSDVFTRDGFTCVVCGARGCYVEADHYPKMFSEIMYENKVKTLDRAVACEELWNINGGRTLCRRCHDKTKKGQPKKKFNL